MAASTLVPAWIWLMHWRMYSYVISLFTRPLRLAYACRASVIAGLLETSEGASGFIIMLQSRFITRFAITPWEQPRS